MDHILELAERLGKAIAESPQARNMLAAGDALREQKDVAGLLGEFQAQSDKITQLENEQKPVEVEDKHKLQDLHDKLVACEVFKRYTAAQVEYVDLMRKVNEAMGQHLEETEMEPE